MIDGLISPILTPFNNDLGIADDLYVEFARHLLGKGGCAGLVPFGTTGEAHSLGMEERMAALDALIDAGIDPQCLIPGTGLTNLMDTARLTRHAVGRGCRGAMILPAFFYKNPADEGLFAYYSRLIDMVDSPDLRICLYHIPQVSGVGLGIDLVRRLRESFPGVITAIKDSSEDWENTKALLGIEGLAVYSGTELPLVDAMRLGAPGCISATANLEGRAITKVMELCRAGKWDEAGEAQKTVESLRLLLDGYDTIPAQKALLARRLDEPRWGNIRPPLLPLADVAAAALADEFARVTNAAG